MGLARVFQYTMLEKLTRENDPAYWAFLSYQENEVLSIQINEKMFQKKVVIYTDIE